MSLIGSSLTPSGLLVATFVSLGIGFGANIVLEELELIFVVPPELEFPVVLASAIAQVVVHKATEAGLKDAASATDGSVSAKALKGKISTLNTAVAKSEMPILLF